MDVIADAKVKIPLTPWERDELVASAWRIARAEMADAMFWITAAKDRGGPYEGPTRHQCQRYLQQLRIAMQAEDQMERRQMAFDRGQATWTEAELEQWP